MECSVSDGLPGKSADTKSLQAREPLRYNMARLLHIESCPRHDITYSSSLVKAFLEVYREVHPADTIEVMNLWKIDMPPEISEILEARYAEEIDGDDRISNNKEAREMIGRYIKHFKSADKYLFTIPTWSFGVPYILKKYIDVITQPELIYESTNDGVVRDLVTSDRPACILYTQGTSGGPRSARRGRDTMFFQVSFMAGWLRYIGFTHVYSVYDDLADVNQQQVREAREKVVMSIARNF